jgi:pimeloyl-ACP methyl ester carboxylesterase
MRPAHGRRELTIRSPDGPPLAAWEHGPPDGRPVVLLHGLTMTADQMASGAGELVRRGFRAIAYDARGHGRSGPPVDRGAYGYDALGRDLTAVMDATGATRAVLAGHSMGCHTALRMAIDAPGRVAGVAAISPAFDPRDHPSSANVAEADALAAGLRTRGAAGFLAALRLPPGYSRDAAAIKAGRAMTRRRIERHGDLGALADALQANLRARPFGDLAELAPIDVPILVVGTHDDLDTRHPLELARAYAAALPGSRFACERQGEVPLGWGGRRPARLVAELAENAAWELPRSPAADRPVAAPRS